MCLNRNHLGQEKKYFFSRATKYFFPTQVIPVQTHRKSLVQPFDVTILVCLGQRNLERSSVSPSESDAWRCCLSISRHFYSVSKEIDFRPWKNREIRCHRQAISPLVTNFLRVSQKRTIFLFPSENNTRFTL